MTRRLLLSSGVLLALVAIGCTRPGLNSGGECTLNSECADPLVCRLERCRRQCVDSRDCGAGLLCLRVAEMGGACQLPEEAICSFTSQCTEGSGLECHFGTCTTACVEDRDCPPGAACQSEMEGGPTACIESVREACIYNSDCPDRMICDALQSCRFECLMDFDTRDCEPGEWCINHLCYRVADGG